MTDEFLWLEAVEGEDALAWVKERNAETELDLFVDGAFDDLRRDILEVLEADDRIPMPSGHGDHVLNFWTDSSHRRGLLRRTTWTSYRTDDPDWETVLDIDALGASEGESWVFAGATVRKPDRRRMLVDLSPGGSDASVTREFDLVDNRFIPSSEGGFERPLAKGWLQWIDDDSVYVGTDAGPGSLTTSGYPRTVRRWQRGAPLADAPTVFEGDANDISVRAVVSTLPGFKHHLFHRGLDFYNSREWILRDGDLVEVDAPHHTSVGVRERWFLFEPRKEWELGGLVYPAGSLLAAEIDAFLDGDRSLRVLFEPSDTAALGGYTWTRNHLLLRIHDNVRDRVEVVSLTGDQPTRPLAGTPQVWTVAASPVDADESDDCLLAGNDFVTPASLYLVSAGTTEVLKTAPDRFDTSGMTIEQHFATSADGTRVPYFQVGRASSAPGPTLLDGYGGFEVANTAAYSGIIGRSWLAHGGTYVLANIRGGGEYGPRWHQAGLRENRHRVYEDFEAVARDLVERGVTTPAQLGIKGGSNGGLLVGNMYVRCPELFAAVVCQVPLLDMQRYHHLLAGASWMAEYGDPRNPDDWAFMQTFSPYHLVEADRAYPPMLLMTSTKDDRVHPGHARKMAARLRNLGHDVVYWENIEGGHGAAADAAQQATMWALAYTFLRRHLMATG
jgi:prolyl oligopeptidase